jgi:hypothetical protein
MKIPFTIDEKSRDNFRKSHCSTCEMAGGGLRRCACARLRLRQDAPDMRLIATCLNYYPKENK